MQYKGLTLDKFQIEAIESINKAHSVVVSAATGTGKTLTADYVIDKFMALGKKIVYTAPIKALSNQKYRDFRDYYGSERVGILTGDVSINPAGDVLVMTTEIYRNMLMSRDPLIMNVSYVIFDEIHFISDIERGTVWEESIIFSPEHIRFLCLSATIPNAHEFASWIESIKKHKVDVVRYMKRAVPLKKFLYDSVKGPISAQDLKPDLKLSIEYQTLGRRRRRKVHFPPPPSHIDLIREVKDKLPTIFFLFSRKDTEAKAHDLARTYNFSKPEESAKIKSIVRDSLGEDLTGLKSVQKLRKIISKGIAYHHAGMLPVLKEIVEILFSKNLIKVLYCTETFAVGINMPAKTVCFGSLEKYDGVNFRFLNSKEYFQLAGRAGRRGIDTIGYVYGIVNRRTIDIDKVIKFTTKDTEPIISRFKLTYNTVLNLLKNHTKKEIEVILKSNFDYYVKKMKKVHIRIMSSFNHKVSMLRRLHYIKGDSLTEKGEFAIHIYSQELLIGELFCSDFAKELTQMQVNIIIAAIVYEERRRDYFSTKGAKPVYNDIIKKLKPNKYIMREINLRNLYRLVDLVMHWSLGGDFSELFNYTNLAEGDIIRFFRRMIDVMRQIRRATQEPEMAAKMDNCIARIDRDIVKPEFE